MNTKNGLRGTMRRGGWAAVLLGLAGASIALGATPGAKGPWSGRDTKGTELKAPAEGKLTVLLFVRPGQGQSEEAMKAAVRLLKDRKDAQVVTVVSGDQAEAGALRLVQAKWGWPVVLDGEYATSGQFGVKVWPTTIVVTKAGGAGEVAHLAGLPVTFANDLGAYVDFAAGTLDKAGLEKMLANREVVADSEGQKAARHVEVAMRMAAKGLTDEAKGELAKAAALKPAEGKLLLTMARVELMIGEVKAAEGMIGQLKAGEFPPGEINVLKGWAAVESGNWAEGKRLLSDAAKLNPDPAEAFYLLGRVYEHEGDAKLAAEYYRRAFERTDKGREMGTRR